MVLGVAGLRCGSSRVSRLCMRAGVGDLDLPVLQRRRGREARDLQDLFLVQGLPLEQRPGERLELLAMLREEPAGLLVALIEDAPHLFVYDAGGLLVEGLLPTVTARSAQVRVFAGREFYRPHLLAHPPAGDHPPRKVGGLHYVALGPCGPGAVDDLRRCPTPQGADDPRPQVGFRVVVAVVLGTLVGDPEGLPPRHDRHPVHGICSWHDEAQDGMTALVVGDTLPLLGAHQQWALGAEHDPLQSVQEVLLAHLLLLAPGRQERRLVDQVPEVGSREPGRQKCLVEHIGLVGGGQHDHALLAGETVHLGEDLVEGLLLLARSPDRRLTAGPSYGIELVDEDDRWGVLAGLLEEVAHTTSADTHEQLDELRGAQGEERHPRLARDGPRQERLARSRGSHEQHTLGAVPPRRVYFSGSLRKSTISTSSFSASSMPATSSNVTLVAVSWS